MILWTDGSIARQIQRQGLEGAGRTTNPTGASLDGEGENKKLGHFKKNEAGFGPRGVPRKGGLLA